MIQDQLPQYKIQHTKRRGASMLSYTIGYHNAASHLQVPLDTRCPLIKRLTSSPVSAKGTGNKDKNDPVLNYFENSFQSPMKLFFMDREDQ
jgi:hypothetical protein